MKVQSLAVIFAIIILPVIIILSYYIHGEIDTIATQTAYDTKLIDATHDAMAAFELNTANENLDSVSDALRSIIEASTNTFFNTLATNLGMSNANKSSIQSYIPAMLYTLYDGYYIYSPTRVPEIKTNDKGEVQYDDYGQMQYKNKDGTYSTDLGDNTYFKQDYILKTYMPYSARYTGNRASSSSSSDEKYDLTINYTLDNYLTIMGNIGNVYYSKTGYLIGSGVVKTATADGLSDSNLLNYNEFDAEKICLSGEYKLALKIEPYLENGTDHSGEISYEYNPEIVIPNENEGNPIRLNYEELTNKLNKCYEKIEDLYNQYRTGSDVLNLINEENKKIQVLESNLENLNAIVYYVKAQIFSNWVYDNLNNIKEKNIKENLYSENKDGYATDLLEGSFHHSFENSEKLIFDKNRNPENIESPFATHKYDVIKNSIQYNLNLALSSYDKMVGQRDIKMPVISDDEWDKILNNVSIVSFMQGFNCGFKFYNNYAIVSSTNNELTVIPNEIYYVKREEYNTGDFAVDNPQYHRIDCEDLDNTDDLISFKSKEIKYDRIYDKNLGVYKYDHKNFACYNCIVNSNYLKRVNPINESEEIMGYSNNVLISTLSPEKKKAYYRAVASCRQETYKTNALSDSSGYEVRNGVQSINWEDKKDINISPISTKPKNQIKAIEVTIGNIKKSSDDSTFVFKTNISGDEQYYLNLPLMQGTESSTVQTITIPVHEDGSNLNKIELEKITTDASIEAKVLNIRIIYE